MEIDYKKYPVSFSSLLKVSLSNKPASGLLLLGAFSSFIPRATYVNVTFPNGQKTLDPLKTKLHRV